MSLQTLLRNRIFLALLSATLVWFSFPNFLERSLTPSTAFLGWIALVPLFVALKGTGLKQGAFLGWLFGFAQFGGILYWIGLIEAAKTLSWLGWLALVLYLSLYFLAFGFLLRFLQTRLFTGPLIAPFLWVALEYIRGSRPWGGFSWGELGYSQAPYPIILSCTTFGGVYGLTFLMVLFNSFLANLIVPLGEKKKWYSFWINPLIALMILAFVMGWGSWSLNTAKPEKKGEAVMLQPSVPQDEKWTKASEMVIYNKLGALVEGLKGKRPDLILWPETAAPDFLSWSPEALHRVEGIVRKSHTHHLVGCLDAEKGLKDPKARSYNAATAFSAEGFSEGSYHKRHLVPFGEFVPFQRYLTFLGPVIGDLGNFDRGDRYERFQANGFSYTPMICYEVIFPGDVFEAFKTHADVLVNISNDAWYGRTASAYQHAQMAIVRSAENRKPLLRCSNTGLCLATDPFGRIIARTDLFEVRTLSTDVLVLKGAGTPYGRFGNWFPWLCWIFVALLGLVACLMPIKKNPR
jgi:apolipoprotein N-acyltransferase